MPSRGTDALVKPGVREAFGPVLQDMANLTNRQARAELQQRWPEIWAAAEPLELTKRESWQAAWALFKAARRAARAPHDKRFRSGGSASVA